MSILVVAELDGASVKKATFAAVTAAKALAAKTGLPFNIVALGAQAADAAASLAGFGAGSIFTVTDSSLQHYLAMPYAAGIASVARESNATWVVMTGTTTGKDVLPRVAVKLGAGLAADVIGVVDVDGGVGL